MNISERLEDSVRCELRRQMASCGVDGVVFDTIWASSIAPLFTLPPEADAPVAKFKRGDKVRVVKSKWPGPWPSDGAIGVVEDEARWPGGFVVDFGGRTWGFDGDELALAPVEPTR